MDHKKRRNSIGTWTFLYEPSLLGDFRAVSLQHLSPHQSQALMEKQTASLPRLRFERAAHARWSELEILKFVHVANIFGERLGLRVATARIPSTAIKSSVHVSPSHPQWEI